MKRNKTTEQTKCNSEKTVSVLFLREYIGTYGTYHKGKIYELTSDLYKLFKADCKKVEE